VRDLPVEFVALLNWQDGVFTRAQAVGLGVTDDYCRAQVSAQRWQRRGRGVYVAFTGPLQERHRLWVALLIAGRDARLSHETAAHLHGLITEPPRVVDVLVPAHRPVVAVVGVRVHRTRKPIRSTGSPPTTPVADTICDLVAGGWCGDRLAALVSSAVQRRLVDPEELRRVLDERGRFRGRAALRQLVADSAAGAHSALELRYLRDVERRHGLPKGARQVRGRVDGRAVFRDVSYPAFGVHVELDGRQHHGSFAARLRDGRRDRVAAESGEVTLRYGWWDIATAACLAAAEVGGLLCERGWTGRFRRCPNCADFSSL
jgi:hypothetical protein